MIVFIVYTYDTMWFVWVSMVVLVSLTAIPDLRTRIYMVPASIAVVYLFLNRYPYYARFANRRKITYEDLEDFQDADPELRKRFQRVFTRIQQIGGALCGGVIVMYGFHVFHTDQTVLESMGLLGGLLSLYARIFGYIGSFSIACLDRMKKKQRASETRSKRPPTDNNPNSGKPEYTKQSNDVL